MCDSHFLHGCFFFFCQDCLTDRNAPKGSIATSCTYFETLAMNSGRLTGTCTCRPTAASGGATETGGTRSDTETDRGGSATAAEARRDRRDPTADEKMTGAGAGAGRGGPPHSSRERTDGRTDPDTVTGGAIDIGAEVGTGPGVEVETESETDGETGVEIKTESKNIVVKVKREIVKTKILIEKRETGLEAQAEKEISKSEKRAKIGAQRNQTKMRNPQMMMMMILKHVIALKNTPKKARKRARRSIRRKAVCLKG